MATKAAAVKRTLAHLNEVRVSMSNNFPDAPRLEHLLSHLDTVVMTVEHIRDEDARETTS